MAEGKDCIHYDMCKYRPLAIGVDICDVFRNTADVVPKSEVEELIRENESLAKTVNEASEFIRKLRSKVKKSKADVAREIFEEINTIKKEYASGDIDGNELYVRLYMLEKKYTEEKE